MSLRIPKRAWPWLTGVILVVIAIGIVLAVDPLAAPLEAAIRVGALTGYLAVFLTSLTSLYMRELTQRLGQPFIKTHHTLAVTGLVALALHALLVAWDFGTLAVFLPQWDSVRLFLTLGGRPALWLLAVAALAAVGRRALGPRWRLLHWLNYLAFWLATAHALLLGTNFQHPGMRLLAVILALTLLLAFVRRRLRPRPAQRR
jgi:DMSO/TMAO reductase YedYZ heme-binding membrane subunit